MRLLTVMLFVVVFLTVFDFSRPAFAYLDPGTGSMILQVLLGGIAGVIMVLKLYWGGLTNLFGSKRRKRDKSTSSELDQ